MWSSWGRSARSLGLRWQPCCSWRNRCHGNGWALAGQGMRSGFRAGLAPQGRLKLLTCDLFQLNEALWLQEGNTGSVAAGVQQESGQRLMQPFHGLEVSARPQEVSQLYLQPFSCCVQPELAAHLLPQLQI